MPLLIQGTAIVIRNDALDRCLSGGASDFISIAPHQVCYGDERVSQASFMSPHDAQLYAESLELRGLQRNSEVFEFVPDFVVVNTHNQSTEPDCDWLVLFEYEGHVIATMRGNDSSTIIAPDWWKPGEESKLQHLSSEEVQERLEFVRREEKVDVYRDKETGKLLYHTRLHETDEEIFQKAYAVVWQYNRHPGTPAAPTDKHDEIRQAIGQLQTLTAKHPDAWNAFLFLGKAWYAIDEIQRAYDCLSQAASLAPMNPTVLKEFAGTCLEMAKTAEACRVGEKAVAVSPEDVELLGNLAVAYLLDRQLEKAKKTISYAVSLQPNDSVNMAVAKMIDDVIQGKREQPGVLADLTRAKQKRAARGQMTGWWNKFRRLLPRSRHGNRIK
ncbi:Tetratricopeptide repeat protein [Planctomycetes bacterium CA13]|uniref:Tetratricopeptide repeat protein n=1 Tax=Novipirellula herctigrandis TaxID=2527986 RepID=A0A5C5Z513_9BACT|nr:Tetratricopeptide repeat protein [Planctomycetes bacterium CA13]